MLSPRELEQLAGMVAEKVAERLADQPRLVDRYAISKILGLSVPTIDRRVRSGRIPVIRDGRRVLFNPQSVIEALEKGEANGINRQTGQDPIPR